MMINGVPVSLPNDPRVSLLDLLRDHSALHGHQEGLQPGRVRRLHGAGRRRAHPLLPGARGAVSRAARSRRSRGSARPAALHPLQQAFVEHDGFQCGYCTPGQICSAVGMAAEIRRGVPSHVTRDLAAETIALSPRRAARADERQSVPLRRAQRHRRGHRRDSSRRRAE